MTLAVLMNLIMEMDGVMPATTKRIVPGMEVIAVKVNWCKNIVTHYVNALIQIMGKPLLLLQQKKSPQ